MRFCCTSWREWSREIYSHKYSFRTYSKNKWNNRSFGENIDTHREATKLALGIMPQEINLSIFEKCIDIVTTVWWYYWVPYDIARPRAIKILTELGLGDKIESTARTLSWGMKRRLMLARSLIHEPKLLILDEPTAWVDVALRRWMWEYLKKLQKETGMTILLTTHYLEEVEALCDHVTILDHWQVVSSDSVKNTLAKLEQEVYVIEINTPVDTDFPWYMSCEDGFLTLLVDKKNTLAFVLDKLSSLWKMILSVRPKENRLETFFFLKNKFLLCNSRLSLLLFAKNSFELFESGPKRYFLQLLPRHFIL